MKIILALDPSASGRTIVSRIGSRPWPAQSSFEVLSVTDSAEDDDQWNRRMTTVAEQGARDLCSRGLNATAYVAHGHPKAAIVDRAREIAADLIVIGAQHGSSIEHFLLGGVASAVIRHAHCSVEVVRPGREISGGMKILLATDGSDRSLVAARSVADRPWPPDTEVRILTAVELSLTLLQSTLEPPFVSQELLEQQRANAMTRAEAAIRSAEQMLAPPGLKTSEAISVLVENPKQIILDEAKNWGADLIVVGSHGRRGLDRFLLGSVSEGVAMEANCSVEVVRAAAPLL